MPGSGLFVPFFNRPASTHKAIALLALEHKPLMMVAGAVRVGQGMKYHAYVEDVIDPLDYAQHPDPVRTITIRFTEALERMIRRHPEQYLWIHRRWKHQPLPPKKRLVPDPLLLLHLRVAWLLLLKSLTLPARQN